jgi:hypothetical protein
VGILPKDGQKTHSFGANAKFPSSTVFGRTFIGGVPNCLFNLPKIKLIYSNFEGNFLVRIGHRRRTLRIGPKFVGGGNSPPIIETNFAILMEMHSSIGLIERIFGLLRILVPIRVPTFYGE